MKRSRQNGVALVITLIMLSVVTFMAITFLALSRRERNAVAVTASQTTATAMSDMALARVQAELASREQQRMLLLGATNAISNLFSTELMVSTNYIDTQGFNSSVENNTNLALANVNYDYTVNGKLLTADERIMNIGRLKFDARPPVYITTYNPTNANPTQDFRFYLDLNRNGRFDSNGFLPVLDNYGRWLGTNRQEVVGDPEWIGVLQNPMARHSATNLFVGRYSWIALPSGKSLDVNFLHNQAMQAASQNGDRFIRNQGVGTWEMNLAAFFHELNTNEWPTYTTNIMPSRNDLAFIDAQRILMHRYNSNANSQANILSQLTNEAGANSTAFQNRIRTMLTNNMYDNFGSGARLSNLKGYKTDPDVTPIRLNLSWPGSDNTNAFYDIQELFDPNKTSFDLAARLEGMFNRNTYLSSYDRYTFYRLLAQLGVDSSSGIQGKMNLNFTNDVNGRTTNFIPWTPIGFFTNAATRLLSTQPEIKFGYKNLDYNNIPVYPVNYYTPAVHRMLQVAANIYDATTNRIYSGQKVNGTNDPYLPTVFRPVFRRTNDVVVIAGYIEETGTNFTNFRWIDLASTDKEYGREFIANKASEPTDNVMVYGVPVVFGAKKGLPNFNEFAMQTQVQVTRKLEFVKPSASARRASKTNQLFVVGISNVFGLEAWNSYTQAYPRNLKMVVNVQYDMSLLNQSNNQYVYIRYPSGTVVTGLTHYAFGTVTSNINAKAWAGQEYKLPFYTNAIFLDNMAYVTRLNQFQSLTNRTAFEDNPNFLLPSLALKMNARMFYYLIDTSVNRVVDMVTLANLGSEIDLTRELIGNTNYAGGSGRDGSYWQTNRSTMNVPSGVWQQLLTSLGQGTNDSTVWVNINGGDASGNSKDKAIDLFRVFLGLEPKVYQPYQMQQELGNSLVHQAPFSPARKISQYNTWQVNDPLVHYMVEDLMDLYKTNTIDYVVPITRQATNSNLGKMNHRYRPWGGNPQKSSDQHATDIAVKDSMIKQSDDWAFPTNQFPNLGTLGRVHRGTPWQTVYLKSAVVSPQDWANQAGPAKFIRQTDLDFGLTNRNGSWMGNFYTHPTNDWRILDLFTTALNDNAARGRLSVNQTNLAAWSAVLSGVSVLTNQAAQAAWSHIPGGPSTNISELLINPSSRQFYSIVTNINATRLQRPGQQFRYLGEVLASPFLTVQSPYLSYTNGAGNINVSDEVVERIPQQILSLLKSDEPRVTVYTFGQTLAPAPNSRILSGTYRGLCTNYQVIGEVVAKHVLRLDGTSTNPKVVRERFDYLPND